MIFIKTVAGKIIKIAKDQLADYLAKGAKVVLHSKNIAKTSKVVSHSKNIKTNLLLNKAERMRKKAEKSLKGAKPKVEAHVNKLSPAERKKFFQDAAESGNLTLEQLRFMAANKKEIGGYLQNLKKIKEEIKRLKKEHKTGKSSLKELKKIMKKEDELIKYQAIPKSWTVPKGKVPSIKSLTKDPKLKKTFKKKGGKIGRPRGIGKALRGYGKAMKHGK
jgi:hypothetical protein